MSNAKIISVISGKGGVGKTFFASNLAFALMSEANAKVLLIGMDNKGGNDIGSVFNIDVMRNASDVLELINKFNLDLIKGYLTKYQATGLDLLPVHSSIDINNINKLLDCLSSIYTYIIVDVSTLFGESEIVIFDKSDMIIVVTTPEVLSVRHTKSMYEMLVNRYHFPREIFKFIANFWTLEYENVDFISLFSQSPVLKIPYDRDLVSSSLDMGIPVLTKNPGSSISKAIRNFANEINNKDNFFAKAKASNAEINMSLSENSNTGTFQDLSLLKEKVHKKLVEVMSFKNIDIDSYEINSKGKELEIEIKKVIEDIFAYECSNIFLRDQRTKLVDEILDEVLGLGPLEDFIRDEEITEIMVNNKDQIYVEKKGKIFLTDKKFRSDKQLRAIIERIVA